MNRTVENRARQGLDTTTPTTALDALGRVLAPEDAVFLQAARAPLLRVAAITPVLSLDAPPGTLQIHLCYFESFTVKAGTPIPNLVRVAPAVEAPPMPIQVHGMTRAESDPSSH